MNFPLQSKRANARQEPCSAFAPLRNRLLQWQCARGAPGPACECEECRNKRLQRRSRNLETRSQFHHPVPPIVHQVLRTHGEPLSPAIRAIMEPQFGHDFSQVRIHADDQSAESARAVAARAYTVGREIVFGENRYAPETETGRRLLAHELTHVIQQQSSRIGVALRVAPDADAYEREANSLAGQIASQPAPPVGDGLAPRSKSPEVSTELTSEVISPAPAGRLAIPASNASQPASIAPAIYQSILQRDADSDHYRQGYQDGLNGGDSDPGPRDGDALIDYQEGFAKGQYEFSQKPTSSGAPAPSFSEPSMAPPTSATPQQQPADLNPAPGPAEATEPLSIAQMDKTHKIIAAVKSALHQAPKAFGGQVEALLKPEALLEFAEFTVLFVALQATPAGWATDLAVLGLEAYLVGPLVFQAVKDLAEFVNKATEAQDQLTIDQAGYALADALGILGIAILMKLLFHGGAEEVEPLEAPKGGAEIKPKPREAPQPTEERVQEPSPVSEEPSKPPEDQTPRDQDSAGPNIVDEAPSVDGERTIRILEDGECEVCASPCQDIRQKYRAELTSNPELATELDEASRMTDVNAQQAEFKRIEQKLADAKAAKPLEPGLVRGAAEARQPVDALHDFAPPEGSARSSGHARSAHGWKVTDPRLLEIRNNPDKIYVGTNANGNQVAVFLKDADVVITDLGDTQAVITAYGENAPKNASPVSDKWASNPSFHLVH
jgi:Domain of unknown function (DUF4157)